MTITGINQAVERTIKAYQYWVKCNKEMKATPRKTDAKVKATWKMEDAERKYREYRQSLFAEEEEAFFSWLQENKQVVR